MLVCAIIMLEILATQLLTVWYCACAVENKHTWSKKKAHVVLVVLPYTSLLLESHKETNASVLLTFCWLIPQKVKKLTIMDANISVYEKKFK